MSKFCQYVVFMVGEATPRMYIGLYPNKPSLYRLNWRTLPASLDSIQASCHTSKFDPRAYPDKLEFRGVFRVKISK